jgi:hypothetical protein
MRNDKVIKSVKDVNIGDEFELVLTDGHVNIKRI